MKILIIRFKSINPKKTNIKISIHNSEAVVMMERRIFGSIVNRTCKPSTFVPSHFLKGCSYLDRSCHLKRSSRAFTNASNNATSDDEKRILIKDLGQGIYNIQLNRPKKCNALDMYMFESIAETISKLQSNHEDMRCIILSGNGRAFCTGLDVPSVLKPGDGGDNSTMMPHTKMRRLLERPSGYDQREEVDGSDGGTIHSNIGIGNLAQDVAYLWRTIPIPVIAVIHGMCFGAGLQIGLGADIRITHESCKLSIMEAKWGLIPDMCASITLRELIPIDVAKLLTFTGKIINGKEAKEIGLVTKCIFGDEDKDKNNTDIHDELMEEAVKLAKEIVQQSPDAIAAAKSLYQKAWVDLNEEQCLDIESRLQMKLLPSW